MSDFNEDPRATDIARVVKVELLDGTCYGTQRYVYKKRWFGESKYEWEFFAVMRYMTGVKEFETHSGRNIKNLTKDLNTADAWCKEWVRVNQPLKPIKVWSTEE
jgi:hypothetical protein